MPVGNRKRQEQMTRALEDMGVVGPSKDPKAREVLMTVDEMKRRYGV